MTTNILEGKTFDEWEYEVKQRLTQDDFFSGIERFPEFIKTIAATIWENVEDGQYEELNFAFDDLYGFIQDEYHGYKIEKAQKGRIDEICLLLSENVDDGYDILCSILSNLSKQGMVTYNHDKLDKWFDNPNY